ncbi:MAG TPA: hypothetical protein PKD61_34040, partial [Polyangiaceae bacterium]|nr:hypothetical protein [Polyangiaceae bacterium]
VNVPVGLAYTGMVARLGFGVAMHVVADVLLVDEVLAVGDGAFQQKCLSRLRELQLSGKTLLFVTHDMAMAEKVCDRCIWIRAGRLEADGPLGEVMPEYQAFLDSTD